MKIPALCQRIIFRSCLRFVNKSATSLTQFPGKAMNGHVAQHKLTVYWPALPSTDFHANL